MCRRMVFLFFFLSKEEWFSFREVFAHFSTSQGQMLNRSCYLIYGQHPKSKQAWCDNKIWIRVERLYYNIDGQARLCAPQLFHRITAISYLPPAEVPGNTATTQHFLSLFDLNPSLQGLSPLNFFMKQHGRPLGHITHTSLIQIFFQHLCKRRKFNKLSCIKAS